MTARALGALFLVVIAAGAASPGFADESRAPKLSLRISNAMVTAVKPKKTSSFLAVGGLEASVVFPISRKVSFGAGYHVDFDFATQGILLHGVDLFGRYYWSGDCTRIRSESPWGTAELRDGLALYAGVLLAQRTYSPEKQKTTGSASSTTPVETSSSSVSAGPIVGADLRFGPNLSLNAEAFMSIFSFATGTDGYKLQILGLSVGFSYFF